MVFVLDADKKPLDMCHPARARQLLRNDKAAVYRRAPFTIILKRVVEDAPAETCRLKIDYGSRHTGFAIVKGEAVPKEHYYDAACVGVSTPDALHIRTDSVQVIRANGRGTHQRTNVDSSGFPRGYLSRKKQFFGFQSGNLVKAIIPKGKKAGTYVGVVGCRATGSFDIRTKAGCVQGLNHKYFHLLQRADGYQYYTERRYATSSPWMNRGTSVARSW